MSLDVLGGIVETLNRIATTPSPPASSIAQAAEMDNKHTHQPQEQPPRPSFSTEDDRRHILAESIAPSSSASMINYNSDNDEANGDRTPRARSPIRAPSQPPDRPYRGFPSEAAYLAALQEFVNGRKYVEYETMLVGFYGLKTSEEIASQPAPDGLGLRRKWKARKVRKEERRRGSVVVADGGERSAGGRRRNTVA